MKIPSTLLSHKNGPKQSGNSTNHAYDFFGIADGFVKYTDLRKQHEKGLSSFPFVFVRLLDVKIMYIYPGMLA
jgi:hypothetical protein